MYPRGKRKYKTWKRRPQAARWTHGELEFVAKHYLTMPVRDIAKRLGRSYHAVIARAQILGIRKFNVREWTAREEKFLREHYPEKGSHYVARALRRKQETVIAKANQMLVYSRVSTRWKNVPHAHGIAVTKALRSQTYTGEHEWTARQLARLEALAPTSTARAISLAMNIYYPHVTAKMREMGLGHAPEKWTKEETAQLRALAPTMNARQIARVMKRTVHAVRVQAQRKKVLLDKVPAITPRQERFMLRNYKTMQYPELSARLGLSVGRIQKFLNKDRGLFRDVYHQYTERDKRIIRRWYHKKSAAEIGAMIGAPREGIVRMAMVLGINKKRNAWTAQDVAYVRRWYARKPTDEMARTLGRPPKSVAQKAKYIGVRKMRGTYLPYSRQKPKE